MKYVLLMYLCSFAVDPPVIEQSHVSPIEYNSYFECITDGYVKSYAKMLETGQKEVDKKKLAIKFECKPKGNPV